MTYIEICRVNLLNRAALALNDKEVHNHGSQKVTPGKDISIAKVNVAHNKGCKETNIEIPDPVTGRRQRHALGAISRGEDLSLDRPDHGPPRGSKAQDEEARKHNEHHARGRRPRRVVEVEHEVAHRGEDHEADKHPDGAADERLAAAVVLDQVQSDKSDGKVDGVEDNLRHVRVDLHRLEDRGAVVEEVVGTRQLLEHLERHAQSDAVRHPRSSEHARKLLDGTALDLVLGAQLHFNLLNLRPHGPVVLAGTVHAAQRAFGPLTLPVPEVETRRLGEKQDTDREDDGPDPADANYDALTRRAVGVVLHRAIVEQGR
jgi:hypothetical protein